MRLPRLASNSRTKEILLPQPSIKQGLQTFFTKSSMVPFHWGTSSSYVALFYMTLECSIFHGARRLGKERGNDTTLDRCLHILVVVAELTQILPWSQALHTSTSYSLSPERPLASTAGVESPELQTWLSEPHITLQPQHCIQSDKMG